MPDPNSPNLLLFFGRLHPLLVHLPIGFLAILAVLELANRLHRFKHAAEARSVILFLTVVASVVAVACGLMLASAGGYDPHLLFWHKWMGIALTILCILTAISFWSKQYRIYGGLLMITLLLLGPASHFGGSMTHGSDYLITYAPNWMRVWFGGVPRNVVVKPKITDPQQAVVFRDIVQPTFAQNCLACHNAEKFKGQLRLDSFENLAKGGASGPAMVAGKASDSLLIQRILLPTSDAKHMPPPGVAQPTDDQITLLRWWIDAGAPWDKTVAELNPSLKLADAITSVLGIVPTTQPAGPPSLDEMAPQIAKLQTSLGIVIEPVAADQPWLSCNTSVAKVFGDAQLAQLAPIARNIVSLNLAHTEITDAGLVALAGMSNLQRVRLEDTAITDAGLLHLAKLRKLEYVNLHGTAVTDAGLKTLQGLPSLHHVYLWRTKVTPEAAKAFADAMVDHVKLQRWQDQIAMLQSQIANESIEVFQGVGPTTAPTTVASTAPSTAPVAAVASTAPTAAVVAAALPINQICPVSGKPIDPTKFIEFEGKRIAFCCEHCPAEFQKNPAKYRDKLALATTAPTTKAAAVSEKEMTRQQAIAETMRPYDGPFEQGVDPSTLTSKVMCGYQGWFTAAGDGAGRGWYHWTHGPEFKPGMCKIDLWPDVSELDADERYVTPFKRADGSSAEVYSAFNKKTVLRHFKWMKDYGLDGVFVQRFAAEMFHPLGLRQFTTVLASCREGANRYGRTYAVMYDLSGIDKGAMPQVMDDWKNLVDRMKIRDDKAYLHHNGKPVVAVWGFGFNDGRKYTLDEGIELIRFLKSDPKYGGNTVMVGVPYWWRDLKNDTVADPKLHELILAADIVSPWAVGRYRTQEQASSIISNLVPKDIAWCKDHGKEFLPVVFPGFSWHNMNQKDALNAIPRLGGKFLWTQYAEMKRAGATMVYQAMFDEVDEGTAIFKVSNNPPVGESNFVTYEGLPSDFYLKLVGQASRMVRGEIPATDALP